MAAVTPYTPTRRVPLIAPTAEAWRAMTPAERERLLIAVNEALSDPLELMSEGRPHKLAKGRAVDVLSLHFRSTGRAVYLAEDLSVLYPGEPTFCPDVLAVCGVPEPADDRRLSWVVMDEGQGIDLALEVLHNGNRKKDLVVNLERYARLGIPEYFIFDARNEQIHGHRLPRAGASRYERIVPQGGRYHSSILDLDLMVVGGKLQFLHGATVLISSDNLINRLEGMLGNLETKVGVARENAERAYERAQAESESARATLRETIVALLAARGIPCPDEARARLDAHEDLADLQRLVLLAATAGSLEDVLSA